MLSVAVLALALAGNSFPTSPAASTKSDQERILGVWQVILVEHEGELLKDQQVKLTVAFTPTMFLAAGKDGPATGSFTLHPTRSPKAMDMKGFGDGAKTANGLCIYELEGDTLRICIPAPGKSRPTELSAKPKSAQLVLTLKRVKE